MTDPNPKKVRVLFFYHFYKMTGGPVSTISVIRYWDRSKIEPVVVLQKECEFADRLREMDIKVIIAPSFGLFRHDDGTIRKVSPLQWFSALPDLLKYNAFIRRVLREESIDVLWVKTIKALLLGGIGARRQGVPILWDSTLDQVVRPAYRYFHFFGLSQVTAYVSEGDTHRDSILSKRTQRIFKDRIFPTLLGGPMDPEKVAHISALYAQKTKKPTDSPFTVSNVGLVNPRKNQRLLVEAAEEVLQTHPDLKVNVLGPPEDDPTYFNELKAYIASKGLEQKIIMHGWTNKVPEFLMESDLFVFTSNHDAIAHATREALLAGLPIVSTRCGGVPEIVLDNQTGFVVEVGDKASIVEKIRYFMDNPHEVERMGQNGRALATQKFDTKRVALGYQNLIRYLAGAEAYVPPENKPLPFEPQQTSV